MKYLYDIFLKYPKICIDTRKIEKDSLFFSLKGPNFNANSMAEKALDQGCAFAVIDEKTYCKNEKFILVDDVLLTLQKLANHHRKQYKIPFLAITGSNGKTTTKELVREVLCRKFQTCATEGNLNNHIGVPLTVLSVKNTTEIAIIEMGANHIGEIAALCEIALPTHGIITNIGKAHLEGFGSFDGVIKAKGELYNFLRENDGTVFVNGDNPLLMNLVGQIRKITYGKNEGNDYIGKLVEAKPMDRLSESGIERNPLVNISWKKKQDYNFNPAIGTQIFGNYNFENILSAISAGDYFGVEKNEIKIALANYSPVNKRSQVLKKGSNTIVLDCYNANPVSMAAAINNFAQMPGENKIAILGDMLELGDYSRKEHENVVEILTTCSFSKTILVGKEFSKVQLPENFLSFLTTDEATQFLISNKAESSLILLKGSRGIHLESLVEIL